MAYYTSVLESDEEVRFIGTLHPVIYVPGMAVVVASLTAFAFAGDTPALESLAFLATAPAAIGVAMMLMALIRQFTTEIVLTNRRLIYKTGLVARDAQDLSLARIQGADLVQSALGRMAGFGDVEVKEVGDGCIKIRFVARPLDFRRALGDAIHARSMGSASPVAA